jgi:uncharacterized membrane protein (DUF2068 family)
MPTALRRPPRPPEAVDLYSSRAGLKAIAVFEAIKGVLVLAAGFGLLALIHRDLPEIVDHMIHRMRLDPEGRISLLFMRAAEKWDGRELAAAAAAFVYSTVRFVEAYGLWHARVWAEWFAILSGCLYLPWEIYEVARHPGPMHWAIFGFNVLLVLYLVRARLHAAWFGDYTRQ